MAGKTAEYDPWKIMKQVYVPKRSRTEQATLEVGVNDRTFFVPKDQMVEVPLPVALVVEEKQRAERALEDYQKKASGVKEFAQ